MQLSFITLSQLLRLGEHYNMSKMFLYATLRGS